ncbi:reverse transcriptase [Gossypium australe]|uniref:Reverse transcriptase n=1 Tax=Gossypium australe TaxID=47621 RepID=A0A5B6V371_9ROSI|nr:reverse transcriptase [Gossypium australe]
MIGTNQLGVLPCKPPTTPITTKATLASHHNNHRHPHHRLPYKAAANSGSTTPIAKAKADAATAMLKCLRLKLAETVVDFVLCFLRIVSVVGSSGTKWFAPPMGVLKFNVDRAAHWKPGPAGCNGVLCDQTGEILALFSGLLGSLDSNEAELR